MLSDASLSSDDTISVDNVSQLMYLMECLFSRNFRIQPLTPNLAPIVLPPADQANADVFIYSPFQERDRVNNGKLSFSLFNLSSFRNPLGRRQRMPGHSSNPKSIAHRAGRSLVDSSYRWMCI
jgi:hypothetical protein